MESEKFVKSSDVKEYFKRVIFGFGADQKIDKWVDSIPAADVRPVVRGEWFDDSRAGLIIKGPTIRCSICAEHVFLKSMYCPACGAVMKGAGR